MNKALVENTHPEEKLRRDYFIHKILAFEVAFNQSSSRYPGSAISFSTKRWMVVDGLQSTGD